MGVRFFAAIVFFGLASLPTFVVAQRESLENATAPSPFQPRDAQPNIANEDNSPADEAIAHMKDDAKLWNLPLPTLGGKQFWTDHRWWNGWRIQHNSTLDHWRLLDPHSIRKAWGGKQAMLQELDRVIASTSAATNPTEVVLLLHGLMRSSSSMQPIEKELRRVDNELAKRGPVEGKKRECIAFSYASTRDPISAHSAALRELVENLAGEPSISVVGHSMGNIVFRQAIGEWQRNGDPKKVLSRMNRVVMLGPPNQGSSFAAKLSRLGLFETITGNSGMQLGPSWDTLRDGLGTPPCPFAIVAGDISKGPLQNPLLSGPSDGVVTIEEASLEGMAEIASVPVVHSFLMSDASVVRATVSFLSGSGLNAALDAKR
jgi:pimeloyl-ACP methyl ester carboxylesterase